MLGVSTSRTEPLGPQALPMDYAVLLYAANGDRSRLTSDEIRTQVPWMSPEFTHVPYCHTSNDVLEMIRVDLGGSPRHVAKKTAQDCSRRLEIPEFRQLVESNRFQAVVLTTTASKARLIREAIESISWNDEVRLHLAVIPRLIHLNIRPGQ